MSEETQRRLAAILAADVFGYSRLMAADEDRDSHYRNGVREGRLKTAEGFIPFSALKRRIQ